MVNPYDRNNNQLLESFHRIHANSEQTHVYITQTGDSSYAAIAIDIDPRSYEPIAGECVAFDPTREGVSKRALSWMEQHPKGIAGENQGQQGLFMRIIGFIKRLNDWGNNMIQQDQNQQNNGKEGY